MDDSSLPDQQTPEREPSKRRSSRKKKIIIGFVVTLLLVVAYFAGPPLYDSLKAMRAESFFNQGQQFLSQGQWTNALDRFELALQMDPEQTRFRVAMARASEKVSVDYAIRSWVEIMRSPSVTTSERQDYVQFLLGLGRVGLDRAGQQIELLMRRRPPEARSLSLASEFYRVQGDVEQATLYARVAFVGSPDDDNLQLKLGSLLLSSDSGSEKQEGHNLLWELAARENPHRVEAWRRLVADSELQPSESRQLLSWLDASSAASTNAILRANLLWAVESGGSSRRDALVAETISKTSMSDPAALNELLSWLNYRKAFEQTLRIVDDAKMGTNVFQFTMRLDALAGLKRWDEAEALLLNTNVSVEKVFRLGMAAYLKSLRGDKAAEKQLWEVAIQETTNGFAKAASLAGFAERVGRNDISLRAYSFYRDSPTVSGAWVEANRQSYRIYMGTGNLRSAREALSRIVSVQKVDDRMRTDFYYLNVLLGEQVRATLEECLREVRGKPDRNSFRILAALAHVRQGDPAVGLQLLQSLPVDPKLLPARWRAIAMTVFRVNGKVTEWTQLSETLSNSGFSKTELQILNSIGTK